MIPSTINSAPFATQTTAQTVVRCNQSTRCWNTRTARYNEAGRLAAGYCVVEVNGVQALSPRPSSPRFHSTILHVCIIAINIPYATSTTTDKTNFLYSALFTDALCCFHNDSTKINSLSGLNLATCRKTYGDWKYNSAHS